MDEKIPNIIGTWEIQSPVLYCVIAALASLLVRTVSSLLKALEKQKGDSFIRSAISNFSGVPSDEKMRDYWIPFFLGWIELACFPVLMRTQAWAVIVAWLAFKTFGQ